MKIKCKMKFEVSRYILYGDALTLYVYMSEPYKTLFGNINYKNIEINEKLLMNIKKPYNTFLEECITYLNTKGAKEEMFEKAIQLVKKHYNVSDEDIKTKDLEKQLLDSMFGYDNKEFEVEIQSV